MIAQDFVENQHDFGVVKEVVAELVDTLEHGVDTGHGKGPWDHIGGAAKRMISQDFVENQQDFVENQQDFAENQHDSPDRPPPYFPRNYETQSSYSTH